MEKAIVGVFDQPAEAQQARSALLSEGFSSENVRITSSENVETSASGGRPAEHDESFGEKLASFFGFGADEDREIYSEAVRRGSVVLVADVATDSEAIRAEDIMEDFHPIDIDERTSQWRESGWHAGETRIPVVEEELEVGKRETRRGGIHVRSHTYEEPVEDEVTLREEHATVERRPADRAASDEDFQSGEVDLEVHDTEERPVISKQARVKEEVVIGKEASDRTEKIRDSVRRTDVDVEEEGSDDGQVTKKNRRRR